MIHVDFETRSAVDLKKAGLDVYARHPSTDVWCMAWARNDDPVLLWDRNSFAWQSCTGELELSVEGGATVIAHNAQFELAIWNHIMVPRYGWPELRPEQVQCTMVMAYAMALPGSLEKAAAAVGFEAQKDMAGHRVMMQLSKPRRGPEVNCRACGGTGVYGGVGGPCACTEWWDDPAKLATLYAYCKQDIEVERQLYKRLLPLSESERRLWLLDQKINNRGVAVDTASARKAVALVAAEKKRLDEEMRVVTGNAVATCTATGQLTQWLRWRGLEVPSVAKADVLEMLDRELPDDCRRALLLRQEAAKSSTAKLDAMIEVATVDGRARGLFQYHGAGTGRWAGRKIQTQNMQRPTLGQDEIDEVFDILGGVA
jgi:DNA polymerase